MTAENDDNKTKEDANYDDEPENDIVSITSATEPTEIENSEAESVHEDNKDDKHGNDSDNEATENDKGEWITLTKSGRKSYAPKRLEVSNTAFTPAEANYYSVISTTDDFEDEEAASTAGSQIKNEICEIGAGVGGGFKDTHELHVMKYKETMKTPDKDKWLIAVKEELERFKKFKVFEPVKLSDVPKLAKMLTTTWAMKKKSNGTYIARLNMRGYEQID